MENFSKKGKGKFKPTVDYTKLRFSNITGNEYRHLFFLLFWPLFMLVFYYLENVYSVSYYYPIHCFLDDYIPFCEIFAVPYIFWFALVFIMHVYTLFYDVDGFKKMIKFIIITYSFALAFYFVFPNCQQLRPDNFERMNIFTRITQMIYANDTNTNVCPSIHVSGSVAMIAAVINSKTIKSSAVKITVTVLSVLICLSTVFLKQHSVIDVLAALPVCYVAYRMYYVDDKKHIEKDESIDI